MTDGRTDRTGVNEPAPKNAISAAFGAGWCSLLFDKISLQLPNVLVGTSGIALAMCHPFTFRREFGSVPTLFKSS